MYILDTFWEFFGYGSLATARNVKKFLAIARHGQPKNSPNMVNIYIKLLQIQCWTRIFHSNDDLECLKEVIDLVFRRILSDVVIFGWPVENDQFSTLLKVKFFEIPYFEVKYCYKLLNNEICMSSNIIKQLELMGIE